ncbi:putative secreted protein [Pseudarthrobacter siccitolerans]|uniref:Putative secreted protein n=2 Tax=Pseudarthrobacter siccitolerans TaxID=861266 RepID=A0A024H2P0_9MICC|nr:putative secreted protein [Pseudarthrobacter siccitolerans]
MGIGVAIGVIAFRKVTEAQASMQSALGPQGLNRAVGRLTDGIYDFADAIRDGMRERETDLRAALGVDSDELVRR